MMIAQELQCSLLLNVSQYSVFGGDVIAPKLPSDFIQIFKYKIFFHYILSR